MTREQETQLLQAIYDRLFDAITYQPTGGNNPFSEDETFIHFSKNAAVCPESFLNPRTPSNPLGDTKASEEFSRMVDQISPLSLEWENSNDPLSSTYRLIVNSANSTAAGSDEKSKEMYQKAYNYLRPLVTTKDPFTGEEKTDRMDSSDLLQYETNMSDYLTAVTSYRLLYNKYLDDLESKDPEVSKNADRDWQVQSILLENNIKKAYRTLTAGNAKYVEKALDILKTTINDGVSEAIFSAQEAVADDKAFSSSLGFSDKWLFSYPIPGDWASDSCKSFTELHIDGGQTTIHNQKTTRHFNMDANLKAGLWKMKVGSSGQFEHSDSSTDKDSVRISAKIAKVSIQRPWFMESLFRLANWTTNMASKGGISNGKIDSSNKGLIPMYPVAFIVAKDIVIKANFTHEDEEHIKRSAESDVSVGWGPFSIGGSYGYGHTEDHFHSEYQNGEIRVPGMQIIAWVSRVIPYSTK